MRDPTEASIAGNKYYKLKMLIPVDQPIKDRIEATNESLGDLIIRVVYERLNKVCLYCANLGHEHTECVDWVRMQRLARDPKYKNNPQMRKLTNLNIGPWINDHALIPYNNLSDPSTGTDPTRPQPAHKIPTHPINPQQHNATIILNINATLTPRRKTYQQPKRGTCPSHELNLNTSDPTNQENYTQELGLLQSPHYQTDLYQVYTGLRIEETDLIQADLSQNMAQDQANRASKRRAVEANRNLSPPEV